MLTKKAIALRHLAFEDLGGLEPILRARGYDIVYLDVGVDAIWEISPLDADLVVVLGGPIGVYESGDYPFLVREIAWLRARVIEDLPTLGICLGAQLMAAALNAAVYPGAAGKEVGWAPLKKGGASAAAAYFDYLLRDDAMVLHWHGDTFDLPAGCRHLAASDRYVNQAFSSGENCLALQFHPEFDVDRAEQWLIGHACEIAHTAGIGIAQLRSDMREHGPAAQRRARQFWHGWLDAISGAAVAGIAGDPSRAIRQSMPKFALGA